MTGATNRVAIVDYGLCNLDSVGRAVEEVGGQAILTEDARDLAAADRIVLPGVGAFPQAMANLRARSLVTALVDEIGAGAPFLGICLGMQLLAAIGEELGGSPGLGVIAGVVSRIQAQPGERVPHVGWNEVQLSRDSVLFSGIPSGSDFYFVHSYHFRVARAEEAVGTTPFAGGLCSVVEKDSVFGVQFHPEKSQHHGLRLLANFLSL